MIVNKKITLLILILPVLLNNLLSFNKKISLITFVTILISIWFFYQNDNFEKINFFNNKLFSLLLKNLNKSRVLAESIHKIETINKVKNVEDYYKKMISQNNQSLKIYKNSSYYQIHYLKGANDIDAIKMMQIKDISNYLPDDILTKVDRASMSCGLEVRVPFLEKDLLKLTWTLDSENKNSKKLLKNILYKYVPEKFLFRVEPKLWAESSSKIIFFCLQNLEIFSISGLIIPPISLNSITN